MVMLLLGLVTNSECEAVLDIRKADKLDQIVNINNLNFRMSMNTNKAADYTERGTRD